MTYFAYNLLDILQPNDLHLTDCVTPQYYSSIGKKIMDALQENEVETHNEYTTKSRNYKLGMAYENMGASAQGHVVFDSSNQLPREVLLETTLKAFGFNMDVWEVCNTVGLIISILLLFKK